MKCGPTDYYYSLTRFPSYAMSPALHFWRLSKPRCHLFVLRLCFYLSGPCYIELTRAYLTLGRERERGTMPSIPIGTTFSGPGNEAFKTTDFLGQGAFGEVYRAVGETSGRVVAVKLLPLGALADADSRIALLNEINTAQQIRHPNVVQGLFVNDGASSAIGPYAVMEYMGRLPR